MSTKNMIKKMSHACLLSVLAVSTNAYSGSVNDQLNDLHARLHNLEAASKNADANVQIHGVVEVEYGSAKDYDDVDSSDIVLATVELSIESSINDNVDVQISLLHEEDDTPLEVDVGVVSLHDDGWPVSVSIGQMYVPFGAFDSNMVSDPLTLELGEARESSVLVNHEANDLSASFYVFNGDIEEGSDDDKVAQFGISLGFENDNVTAGVDYISAISDTDGIQDALGAPATVVDQVAGLSAHAAYTMDSMTVIFEYVTAMDSFDVAEIPFKGQGAEPSAINLEFVMGLPVAGRDSTIAVAYQTTDESLALGLPETRTMIAFSTELFESTSLAFEYLVDKDYGSGDGGSGDSANAFTVHLATEF